MRAATRLVRSILPGLLSYAASAGCIENSNLAGDTGSAQETGGAGGAPATVGSGGAASTASAGGASATGGGGAATGAGGTAVTTGSGGEASAGGSGGTATTSSGTAGSGASSGCLADEKACGGSCVTLDEPSFGCAAPGCAPCGPYAHAGSTCAAGACAPGACDAGYGDCDGQPGNGCEVVLDADASHCGSCATACAAGESCVTGACVPATCGAGLADCNGVVADGCEANLATDANNCGACGTVCQAPATCVGGLCSCSPGTADCNGAPADGCETNVWADVSNCGGCGIVCSSGPNAPASCSGGMCGVSCTAPMGDCNDDPSDGCEVDFTTDPKNCGKCAVDCAGASCVQGACECAAESQQGQLVPLDLYIMLDQSGSMDATVSGGQTAWQAVTTALKSFFSNPANADLGVGIQYFAITVGGTCPSSCNADADCGSCGPCFKVFPFIPGSCLGISGGESCDAADYATPEVEIAPLATNAGPLSTSIDSHAPSTNTPTGPALQGAIDHSKAWAQAHPMHKVLAVLATDGEPTECSPQDIPSIKNIAAAGVASGVKTFVIGVGSSLTNLNEIAAGGGTGQAFLVDTNANVVQQFEAALEAIQQTSLGCEYLIPQPAQGQLDYDKVNVTFTPGNGGSPQMLLNMASQAACGPSGGWYYDVTPPGPPAPTKIILCDATCSAVQADGAGKIDILLGCATNR